MSLGKTLLIANPQSQNGNGLAAAHRAAEALRLVLPTDDFSFVLTESVGHGNMIAKSSSPYDTVIALGGDGLVHEVVNGLMSIPEHKRPVFALLPMGSGNDYARTLQMDFSLEKSLKQLLEARPHYFDLGCCNGEYFVETLSFGLDAAIALDTAERRVRTGKTGTPLFLASGFDMLFHHMNTYRFSASFDNKTPFHGMMLLFAVQVGPSYGGGFTICPHARTDDGLLDLCIAHPPLGIAKAILIFLLAKNAHHTKFKQLEFKKVTELNLAFPDAMPLVQIDGEPLQAETFAITCVPRALQVLVPQEF